METSSGHKIMIPIPAYICLLKTFVNYNQPVIYVLKLKLRSVALQVPVPFRTHE